jgi:hypothetical protein
MCGKQNGLVSRYYIAQFFRACSYLKINLTFDVGDKNCGADLLWKTITLSFVPYYPTNEHGKVFHSFAVQDGHQN